MNWITTTKHLNNSVDNINSERARRKRVMIRMMRERGEISDKPVERQTTLSQEAWLIQRQQERQERRNK